MTTVAVDVVGIFDSEFRQIAPEGRPLKAFITEPSKIMEHPLEDGSSVADHRVFLPVEIELVMLVPVEDYQKIQALYRQSETVTVRTNAGTYDNMTLEVLPHDETTDAFGQIAASLRLREVQFVETQFQALPSSAVGKDANGNKSRNASTTKRGEQSGKPPAAATERKASILYRNIFGGGG